MTSKYAMAIMAVMVIFSPNLAKSSDLLDGVLDQSADQPASVNWTGFYVGGQVGYGISLGQTTAPNFSVLNVVACPEAMP